MSIEQSALGGGSRSLTTAATAHPNRTFGLSLLALASAAIGVVLLLWAGAWFGASDFAQGSRLATLARVIGLVLVAAALLELLLALGIWEMRGWAWPLGVALTIASMLLTLISAGRGSAGAHTVSILLEIGTLWYLLSPTVREAFRPARREN